MLLVSNSPKINDSPSFGNIPDLTIPLNDVDDDNAEVRKARRQRRRSSVGTGSKLVSPSRRMGDSGISRDERPRLIKSLENQGKLSKKRSPKSLTKALEFSPRSPSTRRSNSNSLKERLRNRLQAIDYCDLNASDTSDTEDGSTSKRSNGALVNGDATAEVTVDESDTGNHDQAKDRTRSRSKQRTRSKSRTKIPKKHTDASEVPESPRKSRSKSKIRARSKSKTKRRLRKEDTETEDDTSINSNSLSGRRGGRRPSQLASDPAFFSDDNTDVDGSSHSKNMGNAVQSPLSRNGRRSVVLRNMDLKNKLLDTSKNNTDSQVLSPISPRSKKSKKRAIKPKKSALQNFTEEAPSLGFLLDSERSLNRSTDRDDLSQVTEEQSMTSSHGQQILLQFDPTNKDHVRSVDQDKAKKSSETIHGHDGAKTLEIYDLAGLPTFERPNTYGTRSYSLDPTAFQNQQTSQTPGEGSMEDGGQNDQWDYGGSHSSRQSRSITAVGKNMFFNKKGKVDGEKHHKFQRRSSDIGARTSSFGAMMRLGGRNKLRDYEGGFSDDESLLKH